MMCHIRHGMPDVAYADKTRQRRIRQPAWALDVGCGVTALSDLRGGALHSGVDTVMACKFFPGPVSLIAGMPDTAPSGAVFFIPSAIFTPLPDYAVTHR
ncbi:hypothetical protein, partial [Escherichia coli]